MVPFFIENVFPRLDPLDGEAWAPPAVGVGVLRDAVVNLVVTHEVREDVRQSSLRLRTLMPKKLNEPASIAKKNSVPK